MAEPMDTNEIVVVEMQSDDVPESERAQFREVEVIIPDDVMRQGAILEAEEEAQQQAAAIQRFVCGGENELPDLYTKLKPEEEDDDDNQTDEEVEDDEDIEGKNNSAAPKTGDETIKEEIQCEPDWEIEEKYRIERMNKLPGTTKPTPARARPTDVDQAFDDDDDDEETKEGGSWPARSAAPRRRTVLNASLQVLMGQANLSFARGQIDIAEKLCLEIIRQNPLAPEPFFTLAEIYESRNTEKYMNFLTIAAHLNAHDRDQWIRIAEMHIAQGNKQQARIYYTKAIRIMPRDYDMRLRKARLQDDMGARVAAMYTRLKMIPHMPPSEAELCMRIAQEVAHFFHQKKRPRPALEAMENAFKVCSEAFSPETLNLYLELLLQEKQYARVVQCLRQRAHVELEAEHECNLQVIYFCVIPNDLLPEFRAKLCVSLVHLQAFHLLGYLIQNVHEAMPVQSVRQLDLYVDITEALMQEHRYVEALKLLQPITDQADGIVPTPPLPPPAEPTTSKEQQPPPAAPLECPALVWLLHAKCMCALKRTEEAIDSYKRVVELSPFCYEAKFPLAALLKQQGRQLEAVQALELPHLDADGEGGEGAAQPPISARLLYERCLLLHEVDYIDEFLEVGYELLSRFSIKLRTREEVTAVASGGTLYNTDNLKVILNVRNLTDDTDMTLQQHHRTTASGGGESDLSLDDEYRLFERLLETAFAHNRHGYNQRLCFAMVTTRRFLATHQTDLQRIIALACYYNDQCSLAFAYLRDLLTKQTTNMSMWNFLSLLIQKGQDLRYHRFIFRLLRRYTSSRRTRLFLAHYHHSCSSYKYALNVYAPFFREQEDPLVALCIAVIFNQMSMQKRILRKTAAVGQALAFAHKYAEWRCGSEDVEEAARRHYKDAVAGQEINYNIGRIYHQCGMLHLAMVYYERALAATHPLVLEHEAYLGLRQEVAFNLHLIYRASGNKVMARHVLYEYCVV